VYGLSFWLPSIIKSSGTTLTAFEVGVLTAIPFLVGAVTMPLNASLADRNRRWRLHGSIPPVVGGVALATSAFAGGDLTTSVLLMTVAIGATIGFAKLQMMRDVGFVFQSGT
jgi:hypothetical protein